MAHKASSTKRTDHGKMLLKVVRNAINDLVQVRCVTLVTASCVMTRKESVKVRDKSHTSENDGSVVTAKMRCARCDLGITAKTLLLMSDAQ